MTEPIMVSEAARPDNSRLKKLLGVGAVVLALVVVGPKLLGGGGGGDDALDENLFGAPPAGTTSTPTPSPGQQNVQTVGNFNPRNPFTPLVETDAVEETAAAPAVDPGLAPPPDPILIEPVADSGDSTTVIQPSPSQPSSPSQSPSSPAPIAREPNRFAVLSVFTDAGGAPKARVKVNDTEMEVGVGQEFAGSYRTESLDVGDRCGVFLFGDRRFFLCEGEETQT